MSNGDNDLDAERYRVTALEIESIDNTGNAVTESAQVLNSKDIDALPLKNGAGNAGNGKAKPLAEA